MPCEAPPSRSHQERFIGLAVFGLIEASDEFCLLSPEIAPPVGRTHEILLVIRTAEDDIPSNAQQKHSNRSAVRKVVREASQKLCLDGVDGWHGGQRSPAQHEPEMIVTDVDGPQVPIFVVEEVHNVEDMEEVDKKQRIGDTSKSLILQCCVGKVD